MIWFQFVGYFVACTVALMAVLEVFALLLRLVAHLPRPFPLIFGILLYVAVACTYALPLFGLEIVLGLQASEPMRLAGLTGYLVCLLIATLYFRHRHLYALKALGYFQSRGH